MTAHAGAQTVDPLTGAVLLHCPDRAGYVGSVIATDRMRRPAGSDPCPFCPATADPRPTLEQLPPAGPWQARAMDNAHPLLRPDGVGVRGRHEVLVLHPDHDADLAGMPVADAAPALGLVARRLVAHLADGWTSAVGWANVGSLAGASQPHPHAQVLAADVVPPTLAAEVAAAAHGCPVCDDVAGCADRTVLTTAGVRAWVPAAPVLWREVRLAPLEHTTAEHLAGPNLTGALAPALTRVLAAVHATFGPVAYNVLWHVPPRGADLHPHLHLLPRAISLGGNELATGWALGSGTAAGYAAMLRRHLDDIPAR